MTYRLFFAIWPDHKAVQEIKNIFKHSHWPVHSKPIPDVDLHMTLNFLGSATEQEYQDLLPAIDGVHIKPFALVFDTLVYWSKPDLLLLESSVTPKELLDLVDHLNSILRRQQWKLDTREFKAHVTLARRFPDPLSQPNLALGKLSHPVIFHVREFCLADSEARNRGEALHYKILQRWT